MSWLHTGSEYQVWCNRDEKLTRRPAEPPVISHDGGTAVLAPRDGDAGGSWIAVNEEGVSLCLLNGAYRAGSVSRGRLVLDLSPSRTVDEVCRRLRCLELAPFAPFSLLAVETKLPAAVMKWDGTHLTLTETAAMAAPLTSSSWDDEGARVKRHAEFHRLTRAGRRITPETVRAFHASHLDRPGASSPCMHRADAATVSFSRISVTHTAVEFEYSPGAPCQALPSRVTRMLRASSRR